jgi:RimJ/RimL family protein N-acetyltransferase
MTVCETPRLRLRYLTPEDAAFILDLLNEPEFIHNIGDRGVRTLEDARGYIQTGPVTGYHTGLGLYLIELRHDGAPIGVCGLLKRDYLQDVDVGFALRSAYYGRGYAFEAAQAVMRRGRDVLGFERIVAITSPDNHASIRLLRRLGLRFERTLRAPDVDRETSLFTPSTYPEHVQDEEQARAE